MEIEIFTNENNLSGIRDTNGTTISPAIYTKVEEYQGYFFVSQGTKIGLLNHNGQIVIPTICDTISQFIFDNSKSNKKMSSWEWYEMDKESRQIYELHNSTVLITCKGKYDIHQEYNSNNAKSLIRNVLTYRSVGNKYKPMIDIDSPLILNIEGEDVLYAIDRGFISGTYSSIHQITEKYYVVKRNGLCGLINSDESYIEIIKPIYENIRYQGGNYIFVCKNSKWQFIELGVSDPKNTINYNEINYLNDKYNLFDVVKQIDFLGHETILEHVIINSIGDELSNKHIYDSPGYFTERFQYINDSFIISRRNEKYGAINIDGLSIVPFKYDSIERIRRDAFLVEIENKYGVIDSRGFELIPVSFKKPEVENDIIILEDFYSDRFAAYNIQGKCLLPPVYKFILKSNRFAEDECKYLYASYTGYIEEGRNSFRNFFSGGIFRGDWKVFNNQGKNIISKEYDCFDYTDEYIIGGYNGDYVEGSSFYDLNQYSGVYDMYDIEGNLLVGGFREYIKKDNYLLFYFGGEWQCSHNDEYDVDSYYLDESGHWLLCDEKFDLLVKFPREETINIKGKRLKDFPDDVLFFHFPRKHSHKMPENGIMRIIFEGDDDVCDYNIITNEFVDVETNEEDEECDIGDRGDDDAEYRSAYDNPYYDENLDFGEQSQDFWENL